MNNANKCKGCFKYLLSFDIFCCEKCKNSNLIFCHDCYMKKVEDYDSLWECPGCKKILCDICIGDEWPCTCSCNDINCYNNNNPELVCEMCFKVGMRLCNSLECDKFCNYCLNSCLPTIIEKIKNDEYVLCFSCASTLMNKITN